MERLVCASRLEEPPYDMTFQGLEELLALAQEARLRHFERSYAQDRSMTPWTAARWSELILSVGRGRSLPHVQRVLQFMQKFQVKGEKEQLRNHDVGPI